jgi:sulfatase maturation enzyme AslB (radical SAM superfamily)
MSWHCPAIDHGIAIFPDQKIRPCCQSSPEYSKPLSAIIDPHRFSDLKSQNRPEACRKCWEQEDRSGKSYRHYYLSLSQEPGSGIQFLDFRHTNHCNLKCRYCGPHFSNQWAKELGYQPILKKSKISDYIDVLVTDDLRDIYWCGGEPLIIKDHFDMLVRLVTSGKSKNISLRYNTNLTVLEYKDIDIIELWKHFKKVSIMISVDCVGEVANYIRSGCSWEVIEENIKKLCEISQSNTHISLIFTPTVSMLNLWFLPELFQYAKTREIKINLTILHGPDYLSLDAIPVKLQSLAREKIEMIRSDIPEYVYRSMIDMLIRDDNEYLFLHAIRHILLLDKIRNEKLWDFLPYKDIAIDLTLKNYEYE